MSKVNESRTDATSGAHQRQGRHHHLSFPNQEERIRQVFGIPSEDPLPPVREDTLARYYAFIVDKLTFPFEAVCCPNGGDARQLIHYVRVLGLIDPGQIRQSNLHGLYCLAENAKGSLQLPLTELGLRDEGPNGQIVDDFAYWFVNWQ